MPDGVVGALVMAALIPVCILVDMSFDVCRSICVHQQLGEEKSLGKLLTFEGRIRRQGFWIIGIALGIPNIILYLLLSGMTASANPSAFGIIVIFLLILVIAIIGLSLSVRRWHDLNKSGWWVLVSLIPILGALYSFVMLGFMPGDQGPNSYGPVPQEGALL